MSERRYRFPDTERSRITLRKLRESLRSDGITSRLVAKRGQLVFTAPGMSAALRSDLARMEALFDTNNRLNKMTEELDILARFFQGGR